MTAASSTTAPARLRVLLAKAGLDAHERGMHVVSRGLRDYGHEVIVLPLRTTPAEIARIAVQEDVDVIGISSMAGGHLPFMRALRRQLDDAGAEALVVLGGLVPPQDHDELQRLGIAAIFPQGSLVMNIDARLKQLCAGEDLR